MRREKPQAFTPEMRFIFSGRRSRGMCPTLACPLAPLSPENLVRAGTRRVSHSSIPSRSGNPEGRGEASLAPCNKQPFRRNPYLQILLEEQQMHKANLGRKFRTTPL